MADAAAEYATRGWKTIRLNGKKPVDMAWQRAKTQFPLGHKGNIGIVTGLPSKLVVLDIDPKKGGDENLDALEFLHGKIIAPTVRTGSGGRHFYFKHPGVKVPSSVDHVAVGIDVRAEGGQIVAPPSIHPDTGQAYIWERSGDPTPMPSWLLVLLVPKEPVVKARPTSEWSQLVHNGVKSGSRNSAIASLAGYLIRHLPEEIVIGMLIAWNEVRCSPPLSEEEIVRTVESIARKEYGSG